MKSCRECGHQVSEQALACPNCGAPRPAQERWDGWGYEYRSSASIGGLPLLHIAFKYRPNGRPVVARGVVAIGQFAVGIVTVAQFGIGVLSVGQFIASIVAVAQFAVAHTLVAQVGLALSEGYGQVVWRLTDLLRLLP